MNENALQITCLFYAQLVKNYQCLVVSALSYLQLVSLKPGWRRLFLNDKL